MDFGSYNKFWAMPRIMGLKNSLNPTDSGTGLLEIVPRHRHVGLWECPQLSGPWHAHNVVAFKGLIA